MDDELRIPDRFEVRRSDALEAACVTEVVMTQFALGDRDPASFSRTVHCTTSAIEVPDAFLASCSPPIDLGAVQDSWTFIALDGAVKRWEARRQEPDETMTNGDEEDLPFFSGWADEHDSAIQEIGELCKAPPKILDNLGIKADYIPSTRSEMSVSDGATATVRVASGGIGHNPSTSFKLPNGLVAVLDPEFVKAHGGISNAKIAIEMLGDAVDWIDDDTGAPMSRQEVK